MPSDLPNFKNSEQLQVNQNYLYSPGRHSLISPVVGSRVDEAELIDQNVKNSIVLRKYEEILYKSKNIYLIPIEDRQQASAIANKLYAEYIDKYSASGLTVDNAVDFINSDKPEFVGAVSNKTYVNDIENEWNTWNAHVYVEAESGSFNEKFGKYLPPGVVAIHEIMHVEQTRKRSKDVGQQPGDELLTTTKTIILLDQIYKEVKNIPTETIVDYGAEYELPLGKIANYYRDLEKKYGNLAEAIVSEESQKFLNSILSENTQLKSNSSHYGLDAELLRDPVVLARVTENIERHIKNTLGVAY